MKKDQVLKTLKENPTLIGIPDDQYEWLVENSNISILGAGEFIFKKDEPADFMIILLSGKVKLYLQQNNSIREMGYFETHEISGLLPFSRLEKALGNAQVVEDATILLTHRSKMHDLVANNYELTQKLVQQMTSRVRDFTSIQQQNEKMMALGKLSAGLAHELNNPAAAIVRSSDSLIGHLKNTPENFKKVILSNISPEKVDIANSILFSKLDNYGNIHVSLKEKMVLEDEFMDWLEDREVENEDEITENLIDYGFSLDDLEFISDSMDTHQLNTTLNWINNVLTTERTVKDIHAASSRISELVQSIKSYSHMDRSQDKIKTNIHKGILDTLKLLEHKTRKTKIEVELNFDENLKDINIYPGALNQVWTNILDNAVDAIVATDSPKIRIKTYQESFMQIVEIEDNGPGIPEDLVKRIFDPFFTTKDVGKGSGMGLDIVRRIVTDNHNGRIEVKSVPGNTKFIIKLPAE